MTIQKTKIQTTAEKLPNQLTDLVLEIRAGFDAMLDMANDSIFNNLTYYNV